MGYRAVSWSLLECNATAWNIEEHHTISWDMLSKAARMSKVEIQAQNTSECGQVPNECLMKWYELPFSAFLIL